MSKSIIIDPGHGGTDPGANGFGVQEKTWNLRISLYQYERLKELGANVAITRTNDKSLDSVARTNVIKNKYDIAISNHWNAFNSKARGIETIHSIFGGKTFATSLANALVKATGLPLRRVFSRKNSSGGDYYFMHRLTGSTTTIIIEYGFIDNVTDHNWYKNDSNFYKAAEAVIEAVCKEIGIAYKAKGQVAKPSVPKGTPGKLFKVQAGAFKNKENAEQLHEKMERAGIDAFVVQENGLYKVQAGAYSVKKNAEKQLQRVTKLVGDGFIVEEGAVKAVPKPAPKPKPKPTFPQSVSGAKFVKEENAFFKADSAIKVRTAPSTNSTHTGTLPKDASINYFAVYEGNGYRWLRYNTANGVRYLPYRRLTGNTDSWGTFHSSRP